jgi:hypothetical protein
MDVRAASWVTSSGWNVAGTTLGVLGLVTGYIFYRRSQQPKTLDWVQLFDDFIVRSPAAGSGISVALKGTELLLPRIARIRIQNTGKQPIRPEDYFGPVTIEAPSAHIHSVDYVGGHPC